MVFCMSYVLSVETSKQPGTNGNGRVSSSQEHSAKHIGQTQSKTMKHDDNKKITKGRNDTQ